MTETRFIVSKNWTEKTDDLFLQSLPIPRLSAMAWWGAQWFFYSRRFIIRRLSGRRYQQEDSFKNYDETEINEIEEKLIQEDRLRFMVHNFKLSVGFDSGAKKVRLKNLYEQIDSTPGIQSILDFGCGLGVNAVSVAKAYPELDVRGFDISPRRIEFAKKISQRFGMDPGKLSVDDGKKLSWADKSVDLIYTSLVLEQLPYDAPAALKEMARVARKKIVLIEPAFETGNAAQKIYLRCQDYVRKLEEKAKVVDGWTVQSVKMLPTYSNPLSPTSMIVMVPRT